MSETTTIRVKIEVQKLLRKVAGAMEMTMQDAAELAVTNIAREKAPWAIGGSTKTHEEKEVKS